MISRLLIIGCGAKKRPTPAPAGELYTGSLFRAASAYARASGCPWLILSALHGVIAPETVIAPYEFTMRERRATDDATYLLDARAAILRVAPPGAVVEVHAGADYVHVIRALDLELEITEPLAGLMIGRRLQWYARAKGGAA